MMMSRFKELGNSFPSAFNAHKKETFLPMHGTLSVVDKNGDEKCSDKKSYEECLEYLSKTNLIIGKGKKEVSIVTIPNGYIVTAEGLTAEQHPAWGGNENGWFEKNFTN